MPFFPLVITSSLGTIVKEELDFFCFGAGLVDRSSQRPNICSEWLPAPIWDNLNELDKFAGFQGMPCLSGDIIKGVQPFALARYRWII
jgi:hypothetical protein